MAAAVLLVVALVEAVFLEAASLGAAAATFMGLLLLLEGRCFCLLFDRDLAESSIIFVSALAFDGLLEGIFEAAWDCLAGVRPRVGDFTGD